MDLCLNLVIIFMKANRKRKVYSLYRMFFFFFNYITHNFLLMLKMKKKSIRALDCKPESLGFDL